MKVLLRDVRRKKGMNLRQLESKSGISRSALSRIERGEVMPDLYELEKIAEGLGVGIVDLFDSAVKYKRCPDIGTKRGEI